MARGGFSGPAIFLNTAGRWDTVNPLILQGAIETTTVGIVVAKLILPGSGCLLRDTDPFAFPYYIIKPQGLKVVCLTDWIDR